jgi:hypothetical protein
MKEARFSGDLSTTVRLSQHRGMPLAAPPSMNQPWRQRRRPPALLRGWPYPVGELPAELKEPEPLLATTTGFSSFHH